MSSSRSCGSSAKQVQCGHGNPAKHSIVRKGVNIGRCFFGCPYWQDKNKDCGFFRWDETDEENPMVDKLTGMEQKLNEAYAKNQELMKEIESIKTDVVKISLIADKLSTDSIGMRRQMNFLFMALVAPWLVAWFLSIGGN